MAVIIIPAYKPDHNFLPFYLKLRNAFQGEIIVVDDGSGSDFQTLFDQVKDSCTFLQHFQNQGKGAALKSAYQYLFDKGYIGSIITCDCDGQHDVNDILRVVKESQKNRDTLVLGCRSFEKNTPFRSQLGNRLTALCFGLITRIQLHDTQTGLRGFHSDYLEEMIQIQGHRYEYEMNVLLESSSFLEFKLIPIKTIYIEHNRASHYHAFKDSLRILKEIGKFSFTGVLSFLIDFVCFTFLTHIFSSLTIGLRLVFSNITARLISSTCNYQMNKRFVFHSKEKNSAKKYILLAVGILTFNTAIMQVLYHAGLSQLSFLKIVVEVLCFFLNWRIQKNYVFKKGAHYEQSIQNS